MSICASVLICGKDAQTNNTMPMHLAATIQLHGCRHTAMADGDAKTVKSTSCTFGDQPYALQSVASTHPAMQAISHGA